jgi:ABC-type transport system involved in multi-copper enzyme maturation permease subunit
MKANRILAVARLVFAEQTRDRLLWLAVAIAVLLAAGVRGIEWINFGLPRARFLIDGGLAAISLGSLFLAVVASTQGLHRHLESGLAAMLLTRGVGRGEMVTGHWLALLGLLAVYAILPGIVLVLALAGAGDAANEAGRGLVHVWLCGAVVAAMALAVGSLVRNPALALCLALMLVAAGYLRDLAGPLFGAEGWLRLLTSIVPDLGAITSGNHAVPGRLLPYAAGHVALWLFVAVLGFRRREL